MNDKLAEDVTIGLQLISALSKNCGETGQTEGALETLERIVKERDELREVLAGMVKLADLAKTTLYERFRI